MSFDELEQVEILKYSITTLEVDKEMKYGGYAFTIDIRAEKKGIFKADKLIAMMDNSPVVFPIGEWVFDIEEETLPMDTIGIIDIWKSPAVGSNPTTFVYDYTITDSKIKIIVMEKSKERNMTQ